MATRIIIFLGTLLLFAISSPAYSQQGVEVDPEFSDAATDKIFHDYLRLRDALVKSDVKKVAKAASGMEEDFGPEQVKLKGLVQQIATEKDLVEQRVTFATLTSELEKLLAEDISGGTVYKLHCPMANDGEGADWLSDAAVIRNPFLGEKMLSCGRVTQEITKQ